MEPDPDELEEEARTETVYYKDLSRSIITHNDSPDIGFEASINPYRGSSHGCSYCMSGDTPILMADGRTQPLEELRVGDEIYGTVRRGAYRRYTKTRVLAHWSVTKPAYRVTLEDGTCLISGGDHRFLTERGWKFVTGAICGEGQRPYLTTNNELIGTGSFAPQPERDQDYKRVVCAESSVEMGTSPPTHTNAPDTPATISIRFDLRSSMRRHSGGQASIY